MKKIIIIVCAAALVLSLSTIAYAANSDGTSQPETAQGEQIPSEAPQQNGGRPSNPPEMNGQRPEMNGQPPEMNGQRPEMNGQPFEMSGGNPFGPQDMIDFDAMVKNGVISQETCDKIRAYMEEHKPSDFPEMNGQAPQISGEAPSDLPEMNGQAPQINGEAPSDLPEMNSQAPQINGEAPSDLPEMNGESRAEGGLLNDLLSNGIITQAEYDALKGAIAE